jgi:hypothetical protein
MFHWFKQKITPPPPDPENPGRGCAVSVEFANADLSWTESVDLVRTLAEACAAGGYDVVRRKGWLEVNRSFTLVPQLVEMQLLDDGGVRTCSTIQVAHRSLLPAGIFEYQHSTGDDVKSAFLKGFEAWVASDLPVFLDALSEKPGTCTMIEMGPSAQSSFDGDRRLILGPPTHVASCSSLVEEPHSFCPCCLFTNTHEAFKELLPGPQFHGVRLFAIRNADGSLEADCRVNGREWEAGKKALVQYAESWPDRGFEYRKQYVAIQSWPRQN